MGFCVFSFLIVKLIEILGMTLEGFKTFFKRVKKRVSEKSPTDFAILAAKGASNFAPVVGPIIKEVIDEFSLPDKKEKLLNELIDISEKQFKEITDDVNISVAHLKNIQKVMLLNFDELRADHKGLHEDHKEILSFFKVKIPTIKDVLKKGDKGDFFKREPDWIDFEEGFIVERREVNDIIENMNKHDIQLVLGGPASGKSLILKNIGFRLTNEDKKVYFVDLKQCSRDKVKKYLENIPKINNEEGVFIVDDAHLHITNCEGLINDFKSQSKGKLIIGSRETSEIRGEDPKKASPFVSLIKTYIHTENITEEIIKRFLVKRKYKFSNERINTVSKNFGEYKEDLWILSWALKTYDQKKDSVEEKEIYKNIKNSIRKVDAGKDKPAINAEDVFLPLSVFYRYEIPIERMFLINQKAIKEKLINQLIYLSEIIEMEEEGRNRMLSLNHSSLAKLYYGAYQRYPELGEKIRKNILGKKNKYKKNIEYYFFYRYLTSTDPVNTVDVVCYLESNWNQRKKCLKLLKQLAKDNNIQKSIKEGIEEEEDAEKIGRCVEGIANASKEVALKLVESIDLNTLSSKIDKEDDIQKIGICFMYIANVSKEVALKLVGCVSSRIDKEDDIQKIGICFMDIANVSKELALKLVESIDLNALSSKIDKEDDIQKIEYWVMDIANVSKEVALKLVGCVLSKIDKEDDIEKIRFCVQDIANVSKEVALQLVDILSAKIDKEDDFDKILNCVWDIANVSKEVALKMVESIDLNALSSKIDKEDVSNISTCVQGITNASKEVSFKLVESIDLNALSSKISKEDDIYLVASRFIVIAEASKEAALKLVGSIDLNALSSKIDKEDDIYHFLGCVEDIANVSKEVAQEFVNRFKPELIEKLQKAGYLQGSK